MGIPKVLTLIFSESFEEQGVLDTCTEQTDDKTLDTEQTNQVIEQASGTEEPEEKQEETENEETSMNESKSPISRADAIPNPERISAEKKESWSKMCNTEKNARYGQRLITKC